ncbi:MAG: hypothetical protein ABGZ49_06295 [Akkermansiaceae bacterium]
MRAGAVMGAMCALLAGGALAETAAAAEKTEGEKVEEKLVRQLPALPVWSMTDSERVKKGEIVAGQDFFGKQENIQPRTLPEIVESVLPEPVEEEPEREENVREIPPEILSAYFEAIPIDAEGAPIFLRDPQELLAQQERQDRESFLKYHSGESKVDMFVYLFDERQELPEEITIEAVYDDLYARRGPTALIFYHLGKPDRAQFFLGNAIRAVVSEDEQNRALRAAVQEAFEKSDMAYQLDNFLVELSIRLYWIERELTGAGKPKPSRGGRDVLEARVADRPHGLIGRALLFVAMMTGVGLLGWLGYYCTERRVRYLFPEVDTGALMGAPHAAGVGAVISFSSAQLPPSQQRDHVPDYLHKM